MTVYIISYCIFFVKNFTQNIRLYIECPFFVEKIKPPLDTRRGGFDEKFIDVGILIYRRRKSLKQIRCGFHKGQPQISSD